MDRQRREEIQIQSRTLSNSEAKSSKERTPKAPPIENKYHPRFLPKPIVIDMLLTYKTVKDDCVMLMNSGKLKFGGEMKESEIWNLEGG